MRRADVLAKLGEDGDLAFLDDEKPAGQPEQDGRSDQNAKADFRLTGRRAGRPGGCGPRAAGATLATTEQRAQAVVEIAPDLVEIRGASVSGGPLGRLRVIVTLTATPAGVIQIEDSG